MSKSPCICCRFSHVWLFVTLWTIACQAPLSMGFSRQEYWSKLPFPTPGDLPDPGTEPSSNWQASSLPPVPPEKHPLCVCVCVCVLVAQSCPTLCNPIKCSLPDFSVHGILWARILECIAMPSSRDRTQVSWKSVGWTLTISAIRQASGKPPKSL